MWRARNFTRVTISMSTRHRISIQMLIAIPYFLYLSVLSFVPTTSEPTTSGPTLAKKRKDGAPSAFLCSLILFTYATCQEENCDSKVD